MRTSPYQIPYIIVDAVLLAGAFTLAFFLRFDFSIPPTKLELLKTFIAPVIGAKLVIYYLAGVHRMLWRYTSVRSLLTILWSSVLGSAAAVVIIFYIFRNPSFPRSVIVLDGILTVLLLGAARIITRMTSEFYPMRLLSGGGKPVLIVGAGDTGAAVIREMLTRPELGYQPVGLIDDDPHKKRSSIHGINVLGTREQLRAIVKRCGAEEVIICMPTVSREVIRDVFLRCQRIGVKCRTVPGIYQLIDGTVSVSQLRNVGVEDILGREPVRTDLKKVADLIAGKSVLVTGAAGSIGSELCRQIYRLQPTLLIMVDRNESGLFRIEQELSMREGSTSAIPVVADVTNRKRVKSIFDDHKPSIIFHAAAYKHVPLMETCLSEALDNNLFGTKTVAEAAIQSGAGKFVFISTDKAVEPISVMGTSKALAEKLVQALAVDSPTQFVIVRFGNVLDSEGSVVPIFRQQILRGGPITITHPEMVRYFMTIPEAVQLVIQAAAMGQGGEIFVLDMGEPVPIVELARSMIQLSGLKPDKDIPIVFTGIRPGEKLREKLFWDDEDIVPTAHNKILMAKNTRLDIVQFMEDIQQMEIAIRLGEPEKVQELLSRMCAHHLGSVQK